MGLGLGLGERGEAVLRLREQRLRRALFSLKEPDLETAFNARVAADTETEVLSQVCPASPRVGVLPSSSSPRPPAASLLPVGVVAASAELAWGLVCMRGFCRRWCRGEGWVHFTDVARPGVWGPWGPAPCVQGGPPAFPGVFLFGPQGAAPEDFSHLPPEQRRKKLQQKVDELNKEIQKEMDQR